MLADYSRINKSHSATHGSLASPWRCSIRSRKIRISATTERSGAAACARSAAGVEHGDDAIGTVIHDANLVLQTTLDGQGVALGILPFIETDLASGRLLRPFQLAIDPGKAYYLIYRKSSLDKAAVNTVKHWLTALI